jgi:hypothetical protein
MMSFLIRTRSDQLYEHSENLLFLPFEVDVKELGCSRHGIIEPHLTPQKWMRGTRNEPQLYRNLKPLHLRTKSICVRTGIVALTADKGLRRVTLIEVKEWRG